MAQLAESQARELRMREAMEAIHWHRPIGANVSRKQAEIEVMAQNALSLPQDDSALHEMIEAAKAEEREMCATVAERHELAVNPAKSITAAIRARGDK